MSSVTTNYNFLKPATSELYDVTVYDSTLDKIDAAIANPGTVSKTPLGLVAQSPDYTVQSGAVAGIQVITNIASFTFKANRNYLIKGTGAAALSVAGGVILVQLQSCSTSDAANLTTGLTELMGYNVDCRLANQNYRFAPERNIKYSVDTTLQIKLTVNATGSGGSASAAGGPTWPLQMTIEDKGMQI